MQVAKCIDDFAYLCIFNADLECRFPLPCLITGAGGYFSHLPFLFPSCFGEALKSSAGQSAVGDLHNPCTALRSPGKSIQQYAWRSWTVTEGTHAEIECMLLTKNEFLLGAWPSLWAEECFYGHRHPCQNGGQYFLRFLTSSNSAQEPCAWRGQCETRAHFWEPYFLQKIVALQSRSLSDGLSNSS